MSPLFFNATRFTLGAISIIPLLIVRKLRRSSEEDNIKITADQVCAASTVSGSNDADSSAADASAAASTVTDSTVTDSTIADLIATDSVTIASKTPISGLSSAASLSALASTASSKASSKTSSASVSTVPSNLTSPSSANSPAIFRVMPLLAHPVVVGVVCGVFLFVASTLQQYGILYGRSAGRAGFITALYIVMVPLLAFVFLHRRVHIVTLISVAVAVVGFYFLCITDGFGSLTLADWLLLFTAVLFAAHILVIDTLGINVDALVLSIGQFATTAILSWVGSLIEGSVNWSGAAQSWVAVVYAGVGSVGIAYTLQVVGQQWVPPTRASLIMSLESFFSVIGGALLLGETMTPRAYFGCALIFVGTLLAQVPAQGLKSKSNAA